MSRMPEALVGSTARVQLNRVLSEIHREGNEGGDTLFRQERPALIHHLKGAITGDNQDILVAVPIMHTIARFGSSEDIPLLQQCLEDASAYGIKESAKRAIEKIRDKV